MPIKVTCNNCKTNFNLKDELLGKKVMCSNCKEAIIVKENKIISTETNIDKEKFEENKEVKIDIENKLEADLNNIDNVIEKNNILTSSSNKKDIKFTKKKILIISVILILFLIIIGYIYNSNSLDEKEGVSNKEISLDLNKKVNGLNEKEKEKIKDKYISGSINKILSLNGNLEVVNSGSLEVVNSGSLEVVNSGSLKVIGNSSGKKIQVFRDGKDYEITGKENITLLEKHKNKIYKGDIIMGNEVIDVSLDGINIVFEKEFKSSIILLKKYTK